jgi:hypothetical protein
MWSISTAWLLADDPFAARLYKDGEVMVPAHLWGAG